MTCLTSSTINSKKKMDKYFCPVCKNEIPQERIAILQELKYNENDFYCVNHAINKSRKAIYSGEHGTSELIMCDKVYNDSVRAKFYDSEVGDNDDLPDLEEEASDD